VLPQEQFDALREVATERGVTVVNLIRKFVKLGLFVDESMERGGKLFKRKAGKEDVELIIL
jgi:hypothetical protein